MSDAAAEVRELVDGYLDDCVRGFFDDLVNPTRADLDAIYAYVRSKRPEAAKNPAALKIIVDFESWYQGLGVVDAVLDQETLNEARRRRFALNDALGRKVDPAVIPADAPYTPPPRNEALDALRNTIDAPAAIGELATAAKVLVGGGVLVLLVALYRNVSLR